MPLRRHHFGSSSDPHPLFPESTINHSVLTATEFLFRTNLSPRECVIHPNLAIPVPMVTPGNERHKEVPASMMWHPLFWLPKRLREGLTYVTEEGEVAENNLQWAIRVLIEMQFAGPFRLGDLWWVHVSSIDGVPLQAFPLGEDGHVQFPDTVYDSENLRLLRPATSADAELYSPYNIDDATWLDVPYLVGVDVFTPEGEQRMRAWQNGASDPDLDSLDLDRFITAEGRDPMWAVEYVTRRYDSELLDGVDTLTTFTEDALNAGQYMLAASTMGTLAVQGDELDQGTMDVDDICEYLAYTLILVREACVVIQNYEPWKDAINERIADLERHTALSINAAIDVVGDMMSQVAIAMAPAYGRYIEREQCRRRDIALEMVTHYGIDEDVAVSIA